MRVGGSRITINLPPTPPPTPAPPPTPPRLPDAWPEFIHLPPPPLTVRCSHPPLPTNKKSPQHAAHTGNECPRATLTLTWCPSAVAAMSTSSRLRSNGQGGDNTVAALRDLRAGGRWTWLRSTTAARFPSTRHRVRDTSRWCEMAGERRKFGQQRHPRLAALFSNSYVASGVHEQEGGSVRVRIGKGRGVVAKRRRQPRPRCLCVRLLQRVASRW